tara:strand:+ start:77 stop:544 length:468 start_codon:yes stop_codon:yes gene_type:complete
MSHTCIGKCYLGTKREKPCIYKVNNKGDVCGMHKNQGECPICYNVDKLEKVSCNHGFCKKCSKMWFEKNNTCPICRAEVKEKIPTIQELEYNLTILMFHDAFIFRDINNLLIRHVEQPQLDLSQEMYEMYINTRERVYRNIEHQNSIVNHLRLII